MHLETHSESQIELKPKKNRKIIVRFMDSAGTYSEERFHIGKDDEQRKFYKLLYWATVNLIELRISPDV